MPPVMKGTLLEFGVTDLGEGGGKGVARNKDGEKPGKHDRPWRKSAAAVKAEREASAAILGDKDGAKAGGVSLDSVRVVMAAQELLDAAPASADPKDLEAVQAAATTLLQVATNARPTEEIAAARATLDAAAEQAGMTAALAKRSAKPANSATSKLQLLHEVMPRLWVGGWAALADDCRVLQQKKVTHVVSVISADQRKLPPFVQGHLYVRVDDTEDAADTLAAHFEEIAAFVEGARQGGGVVFVHCGAGISRAPTSACAYLIWKLRIPASQAIKLVRSARACARPNIGFVAALKAWEAKVLASEPPTPPPASQQQEEESVAAAAALVGRAKGGAPPHAAAAVKAAVKAEALAPAAEVS